MLTCSAILALAFKLTSCNFASISIVFPPFIVYSGAEAYLCILGPIRLNLFLFESPQNSPGRGTAPTISKTQTIERESFRLLDSGESFADDRF